MDQLTWCGKVEHMGEEPLEAPRGPLPAWRIDTSTVLKGYLSKRIVEGVPSRL